MIDKTVIRGEEKGLRFAKFCIKVYPAKMFTEYGLEYIREIAKLLLVDAFVSGKSPEEMDKQLKSRIFNTVFQAAYEIAVEELKSHITGNAQEFRETVKEVIDGEGETENEEND